MMALPPPELSARDRAVLRDLDRIRLLTGRQLERLHFADLATPNARASARRRSLGRLRGVRLVTTLDRRVGGVRAGSAGLIYALDARAQRDRALWDDAPVPASPQRVRRPWSVGWMFVAHTLDVAELYVRFREEERAGLVRLIRFDAEPRSWFTVPCGVLKPDAFAVYEDAAWEQHRWYEVDRATESLPIIRRKLDAYLDTARAGTTGPLGVLPQVVVTVPDARRLDAVNEVVHSLPGGPGLIAVERFDGVLQPGRPPP